MLRMLVDHTAVGRTKGCVCLASSFAAAYEDKTAYAQCIFAYTEGVCLHFHYQHTNTHSWPTSCNSQSLQRWYTSSICHNTNTHTHTDS